MARSDKYTIEFKKPTYYSDFLTSFEVNPLTGLLAQYTNEESVKQSITNLVLTNRYERYEQPMIGSKLQSLLFENLDTITSNQIRDNITETITNCEPRAQLVGVEVTPDYDVNAYKVVVTFSLINIPQVISLDLILKRVR